jgi:tight adherence protein B
MLSDPKAIIEFSIEAAVAALVLSLWIGGVLLWASRRSGRQRRLEQRLRIEEPDRKERVLRLWYQGAPASATVTVASERGSLTRAVGRYGRRAGWPYGPGAMIALFGGVPLLSMAFTTAVTSNLLLGAAVGVALLVVPRVVIADRITRRERLFETQLLDAIDLAARSLRAGHPIIAAFRLVCEEMPDPISSVFGELCQRHEMGVPVAESLRQAARGTTSPDLKMFATSVAIQMKTGGNLADLMDRLAAVIRERIRLGRRVKVLMSQTQTSKRLLIAMPIMLFVVINLIDPTYMAPLYSTRGGQMMLGLCGAGLVVGTFVMNKMAALRY